MIENKMHPCDEERGCHEYGVNICRNCGRDFCYTCCGNNNIGAPYQREFMTCPDCGQDRNSFTREEAIGLLQKAIDNGYNWVAINWKYRLRFFQTKKEARYYENERERSGDPVDVSSTTDLLEVVMTKDICDLPYEDGIKYPWDK